MPRKSPQYLPRIPKGFRRFKETRLYCNRKGIVISIAYGKIRVLSGGITSYGYQVIHTTHHMKPVKFPVHDIVASCWIGEKPVGYTVNHMNGVKLDNNVNNLEYCTFSENTKHAHETGLTKTCLGEKNGMSQLTQAQVISIRELYKTIRSQNKIANMFGISRANVGLIVTRKTWTHI